MNTGPEPSAPSAATPDPARAEAEAERLMAAFRLQQDLHGGHVGRDLAASRWIIVGGTALFGAAMGALMGAVRGHALAGAVLMGLTGGLLAIIRQRAL